LDAQDRIGELEEINERQRDDIAALEAELAARPGGNATTDQSAAPDAAMETLRKRIEELERVSGLSPRLHMLQTELCTKSSKTENTLQYLRTKIVRRLCGRKDASQPESGQTSCCTCRQKLIGSES
jgi:glutamine amidotransferase PdxT